MKKDLKRNLKEGDKVKLIKLASGMDRMWLGKVATVIENDHTDHLPLKIKFEDNYYQWVDYCQVKRSTI